METAAVLHLVPFTNILTIKKEGVWKNNPLCNLIKVHCGPSNPSGHMRRADRRGQGLTGVQGSLLSMSEIAEGSVLPAKPDSQNGVSSAAPGSGLEPLSRGQGELVVPRLCGVSMEVDHPVGGSRGRRGHDWLVVLHLSVHQPRTSQGQDHLATPPHNPGNIPSERNNVIS